jgi:crotonobetainyl-CoA:carnitine CoA-transferase CaiB-like acyl-CoA transferase
VLDRQDVAAAADGALSDVRVVEWAHGIAAGYAGKMLADFGAKVLRIDQPPPSSGTYRSLACETYLDEKKSRTSGAPEGKGPPVDLLRDADILISDLSAAERCAAGIDRAALSTINPRLISVAITPFGLTGP